MKLVGAALVVVTLLFSAIADAKVCRKGKACGNSCISRSSVCHMPHGTAVDAGKSPGHGKGTGQSSKQPSPPG